MPAPALTHDPSQGVEGSSFRLQKSQFATEPRSVTSGWLSGMRDRYGRAVGKVECAGKDAGAHQVSAGMAWVYDRYSKPSSPLYPLQDAANTARRGLWVDNEPVPPREWLRIKAGDR